MTHRARRRGHIFRSVGAIALILISTLGALLIGEFILRFAWTAAEDNIFPIQATIIDDPILGHRIKPHDSGHDALGYRNLKVPEHADVVAIGDSMTYGYGVGATRNNSWPSQVGVLVGESIYNMGMGGYGPLEYLYLSDNEANKLRPRVLIVGFYFGNDLMDSYNSVRSKPYWHDWREVGAVDAAEPSYLKFSDGEPSKRFASLRQWLSTHSVLYSLLRVTVLVPLAAMEQDGDAIKATPDRRMVWDDPSRDAIRTIFTPQQRLSVLDPELSSVQEGLRITKRAFTYLKNGADARGTKLIVVLIPTKERAYCRYLKDSGERMPELFVRLCDAEIRIKEDLLDHFAMIGITHVDVTAAMEEKIRNNVQIFPNNADAHPLAAGYTVIANAVQEPLRRQLDALRSEIMQPRDVGIGARNQK